MILWLLKKLEKNPTCRFRKKDLLKKSKNQFEKLRNKGFIAYSQPSSDNKTYPCTLSCSKTCPMEIVEIEDKLFAICPEDTDVDPIHLTKEDISQYYLSWDILIREIRKANGFTGDTYVLSPRLHFIGEQVIQGINIAFILALFHNIKSAEPHLLSLRARIPPTYSQIVVVTPSLRLSQEPIYAKLRAASITPVMLPASFGQQDFKISYCAALSKCLPDDLGSQEPDLMSEQLVSEFNKDSPKIGEIPEMPVEERRNSTLSVLFLFAQAYYKLLECTVSMASWCTTLDVELNGYYIWIVNCITNLLKNSEDLKDFPVPFEPFFTDLYPSTISDYEWQYMVAPEVEQFLSTVQQYVQSKGIYEPQKYSEGWIFIELYRPSVNAAIKKAIEYNKKMRQYTKQVLGSASPKIDGNAPTTHGEQSNWDMDEVKRKGSRQPNMTSEQLDDYKQYAYLCQDRLHIPGTFPRHRSNDILLNDDALTLGDSLFALLLRFVVELKKGKGGWVSGPALQTEGLISDSGHYQPYSNLRIALRGNLRKKMGRSLSKPPVLRDSASLLIQTSSHTTKQDY